VSPTRETAMLAREARRAVHSPAAGQVLLIYMGQAIDPGDWVRVILAA
jgi:hypothetical protein